ncbi:MAG: hypothetical protein U1C33_06375, partial [Candidatus Cloacimonadaceae bacterium]|nr:hypothetical protein [Candidatus Cloacimonadaceae bacterium]
MSANEFVSVKTSDDATNSQFVTRNKTTLMYPPFFGIDFGYYHSYSEKESNQGSTSSTTEYGQTTMEIGAGFPDPNFAKVMIYAMSHKIAVSNDESKFDGVKFLLQKQTGAEGHKINMGIEYEISDAPKSTFSMNKYCVVNTFSSDDLSAIPKSRLKVFLQTTDLMPVYKEPNYLGGIAPARNPLQHTNNITYLMDIRYLNDTYDVTGVSDIVTIHDFLASINFNFTRYVGLDLAYLYNQTDNPLIVEQKTGIKQAGLRLSLLDFNYLRLQSLIEYQCITKEANTHHLNVGGNLNL